LRVVLSRTALRELREIRAYIHQFNPRAADRIAKRLIEACDGLGDTPHIGRPIRLARRELASVWPYLIRYRVTDDAVIILRIRHGRRRPEP
jgi:toxin ParE1/3/4